MPDDNIWNSILGNNPNGPSVTPFANGLGQGGAGAGSSWPAHSPLSLSGMNLDADAMQSLMDAGVGSSVIADMLPQMDDGSRAAPFTGTPAPPSAPSAAFLSPSALVPSQPLADPTPFALPDMTMDQAAMAWGMSPQQVAAIGQQAKIQALVQVGAKDFLGPAAELAFPELGVEQNIARIVAKAVDTANQFSEPSDEQYIEDAPSKALFNYLNDSEFRNIPSTRKTWIP